MKKIISLLGLGLLLTACALPNYHKACGTYHGVMPAADGPGIDTTLTLNEDGTYKQRLIYIDAKDGTFNEAGTYTYRSGLIELRGQGNEVAWYRLEDGQVRRLDMEKRAIDGPLAEYYVLKQIKYCR